ncbi:MAG: DUF885 family protein [Chloroflexota bacterium]
MTAFDDLAARFLDEHFAADPVTATMIGDHRFDGRWPDTSDAGRLARLALYDRWAGEFRALDDATLTPDERIDRDLVLGELARYHFLEGELREDAWDPLGWVYLIGAGLHSLISRDFAPLAVRLDAFAQRLEGVPAIIADAQAVIGSHPTRPVSRLHARVAGDRIAGVSGLGDEAVELAEAAAGSDEAVAALLPRLREANARAKAVLEGIGEHLRTQVAAQASGAPELGRELFAAKLRYTLADLAVTPEAILARAERSSPPSAPRWSAWPARCGPSGAPASRRPTTMACWCVQSSTPSRSSTRRPTTWSTSAAPSSTTSRPSAGSATSSASPASRSRSSGRPSSCARSRAPCWIPPAPSTAARRRSSPSRPRARVGSRRDPDPGCASSTTASSRSSRSTRRCPATTSRAPTRTKSGASILRRVFASGLFAEGWAVYVTQVMLDRGYAGDDRALWLTHWKFYLRAVTNTIIDVRIHCDGMSSAEAIALMVDGAFQERSEAEAKDERARLSSTQLATYFVGSMGCWDIEDEARRRAAEAAGAGRDAVPMPALPGGYPQTPGFDERAHLEAVISHGEPPIPLLRRILLG